MVKLFLLFLFVIPGIQSMEEVEPYNDFQDLAGYVITDRSGTLLFVSKDERMTEQTESGKVIYKRRELICISLDADEFKKEKVWVSTRGYGESESGYNEDIMIVRYADDEDQLKVQNMYFVFKDKENKERMELEKQTLSKVTTRTKFEMSINNEAAGMYTWWYENNNKVYVSYNQANYFRNGKVEDFFTETKQIKKVDIFAKVREEEMYIDGIQYGSRRGRNVKLDNTENYFDLQEWFLDIQNQGADIIIKKYIDEQTICLEPIDEKSYLDFRVEDDFESHTLRLIVTDRGCPRGYVDHYVLRYAEEDSEHAVPIYEVHLSNGIIYTYQKPTTGNDLEFRQRQFEKLANLLKKYSNAPQTNLDQKLNNE